MPYQRKVSFYINFSLLFTFSCPEVQSVGRVEERHGLQDLAVEWESLHEFISKCHIASTYSPETYMNLLSVTHN